MLNYDTDKIRIPKETYCPTKKIQFNSIQNNNFVSIPSSSNNINTNNSINTLKTNIITTFSNNNKPSTIISNTNANTNINININIFSQDNSSEEGVTISPIKSIITAASSKPQTIIQPQCKLEKFLPPKTSPCHKTLVLDLDETLIHSYFDCNSPRSPDLSYDIFIEKKKIHVNSMVRPGAREFLENVGSIFEIVVFTASLSEYANPLLDFIDKNKKCKFRLFREHCCSFNNGFTNSFTKDLKKLDRDMKNLIIIDNNPKSYMLNKENGVPIKTWVEDINDRELYKLIPYLIFLGNENIKDVRPFLKQVNSGNTLNYDKFDKIISKYNIDNERKKEDENSNKNLINKKDNNVEKNMTNKENKIINENSNTNIKRNIINVKENKEKVKDENNNNLMSKENKYLIEPNDNINNNISSKIEFKKIKENNIENNIIENKSDNKIDNKNDNKKEIKKVLKKEISNIENNNKSNTNPTENNIKSNNNQIKLFKNKKGSVSLNKNNMIKPNNISNDNIIKINKNKINEKSNKSKGIIKNKSLNDMTNNISINLNSSKTSNKEYKTINKNLEKKNKIIDKNSKINNNQNRSINHINKENQNSNIIKEKNYITNKKKEINLKENQNKNIIQNINKRNNSVTNKKYNNKINENIVKRRNDIPYRIRYNNNGLKNNFTKENYVENNRYESIFKEEDNLKIEEHNSNENNNNQNNINKIQREVKNNNNNFIFRSTQEIDFRAMKKNDNDNQNLNINLNIQTAKSSSNINRFRNNFLNVNNNNQNEIDQIINKDDIISKVKKEIKLDFLNSLVPTGDLLKECLTNLNKANSLKNSSDSLSKKMQISDENQEKTIINDDMDEEEKNDYKENDKEICGEKELFDDIDTEKEDIKDTNIIFNNYRNEDCTISNHENDNENELIDSKEVLGKEKKKKCFEADDAFEYSKSKENIKLIREINDNENESNTINAKSSYNNSKRKFNKNLFNKSKNSKISNKKELGIGNKLNRNKIFIGRYQSGTKNGQTNKNKFLQSKKKSYPKEYFNYSSTRKKFEKNQNNISSFNSKLFKEKTKANLYLKYNSNNNENVDLFMNKSKPITKNNSNVFHFQNSLNPKSNRSKNGINENQKISLLKSSNYLNNLKNVGGIKSNNNEIYFLKNDMSNEKKIIQLSNRENNSLFRSSETKFKRPTSCANKKSEKIFFKDKSNNNKKVLKFANQGKKIYLKTNNKNTINLENINNINININDKLNKSNDNSQSKIDNNEINKINKIINKNTSTISPYAILSPSGNIITDIFFVRNLDNSIKTTKSKIKYINFYEDKEEKKEEKQKRFPSAMNGKLMLNKSKNILP